MVPRLSILHQVFLNKLRRMGIKDIKESGDYYGPSLALGSADAFKPSPDGCSVALEVEDFDAAIAQLRANGVKFRIEPSPTPVCRMAMIFDPDGNTICIHKRNKS